MTATQQRDTAAQTAMPPQAQIVQMLAGKWVSKAISVAADLGIADHMTTGPKTVEELAPMVGSHPQSLYRLLRALASVGVFEQTADRFALNALAECLRSDVPGSVRDHARFFGTPVAWDAWRELRYSVETADTGARRALGMESWEYLRSHPGESEIFNGAMSSFRRRPAPRWRRPTISAGSGQLQTSRAGTGFC
jgi:hypothetical protein